jgi:hypothetical protein
VPQGAAAAPARARGGRAPWACAAAIAAFLLAGCGPGTGGTGTGSEVDLATFGATAASVCGTGFSANLVCAVGTGSVASAPPVVLDGTQAVRFIDSLQAVHTVATFEANSVQLDARCQALGFAGDWGITATGDARFFGSYLLDGSLQRVPATLAVQEAPDKAGSLVVTVRDGSGRVVLGPLTLLRAGTPLPAAGPC